MEAQIILPTTSLQSTLGRGPHHTSCPHQNASSFPNAGAVNEASESNPLRMLRSGAFPIVRPKGKIIKGEKMIKDTSTAVPVTPSTNLLDDDSSHTKNDEERWRKDSTSSAASLRKDSTSSHSQAGEDNPIPLPPRDRSKPSFSNKPRHQRKHPLIIPGQSTYFYLF